MHYEDAHIEEGFLKVMGKGSKERLVPIGALEQKVLFRYVFHFRPQPLNEMEDYLFLTLDGRRLQSNAIKLILRRWGIKAGVPRLHAHLWRHTYATNFLTYRCGDIYALKQILGHRSLEMVDRYVHLASAPVAKKLRGKFAWVRGVGWSIDSYYLGGRELYTITSLKQAALMAYEQAGVRNPLNEIDVIELDDLSSFYELMAYEALGLCAAGGANTLLQDGLVDFDGRLPVNPSGGTLSTNVYAASGLIKFAEASLQIMERANGHQLPRRRTALAHGATGIAGQGNCVFVLGE